MLASLVRTELRDFSLDGLITEGGNIRNFKGGGRGRGPGRFISIVKKKSWK